jgi:signal transduction histidine kinase
LGCNAGKFTRQGDVRLNVARRTVEDQDYFEFQVKDTGIGMTPAQIENLFSPFTQADASTTRKYGGTGLGLAISRRFCQMMGGAITLESQIGQGSVFTIQLPAEGLVPTETEEEGRLAETRNLVEV